MPAIPVWNGCRPYDAVPVQFSCHVKGEDGALTHHEWLAKGADDPREELADIFIFSLLLSNELGIDLPDAARRKIDKNDKKYPVAKAKGTAKKYTDL